MEERGIFGSKSQGLSGTINATKAEDLHLTFLSSIYLMSIVLDEKSCLRCLDDSVVACKNVVLISFMFRGIIL